MRRNHLTAVVVLAVCAVLPAAWGADPAPAASANAPAPAVASAANARSTRDILSDMDRAAADLDKVSPPADTFYHDAAARAKAAPDMISSMKRLGGLLGELAASDPKFADAALANQYDLLAMRTLLGDRDAKQTLDSKKTSGDKATSTLADLALSSADWWNDASDAAAQGKILDHITALAKAQPENDAVTQTLLKLAMTAPASSELSEKSKQVATAMTSDTAKAMKAQNDEETAYIDSFKDKIGKPFSAKVKALDGTTIDTAALKGHVVVLDFWATWCGPCRMEMPDLAALYKQDHGKGLDLIGVSADNSVQDLKDYLSKNPDVAWPMVFQEDQQLARDLGIKEFPTKLVIDRDGVLSKVFAGVRQDQGAYLRSVLDPYLQAAASKAPAAGAAK